MTLRMASRATRPGPSPACCRRQNSSQLFPLLLPHLSLMEVVALPHLYAVEDVVTGVQHRLVVTIDKGVAWQEISRV